MSKIFLFSSFILFTILSTAQNYQKVFGTDNNGYKYLEYDPDPLHSRMYMLDNGLKVFLTDYKDEPRIQTYIAVRAGSKYDPSTKTGLAHYLEHLMFKGTKKIGTSNWEKEGPLLDSIKALYELYGATTDSSSRKAIYTKIDETSLQAAEYSIPNEYDRLLSEMGATGTNAYTSFEQTVYVNEIPSNELEKWLMTESERFSDFVPRLFHTELETVYEEKNRTLDSDYRQLYEKLFGLLFQNHQYGTQTTIGTVEDLKNPSIVEIEKYHDAYYVPNNMAICISGDIDMEKTIKLIYKYFSSLKPKELPIYEQPLEDPITSVREAKVIGPNAEMLAFAYRFEGYDSKRSMMSELVSMMLSNGEAGLIDINLNQGQEIQGGYSYSYRLNDYSMHILGGQPREGQTLKEVQALLMNQIELLKKGEFDEWMLEAIVNDYKKSKIKQLESNKYRAQDLLSSFVYDVEFGKYINEIKELEKVSKEDVVKFVNKYYRDNYVVVYKEQGEAVRGHVEKPEISQLPINRGITSKFYDQVVSMPVDEIKPVYADLSQVQKDKLKKGINLSYMANNENELFELYYVFEFGKLNDPQLSLATSYLNYIGSEEYSAEELQKEFYKIGCSYSISSSDKRTTITLSGLNENFDKGVALLESFLAAPKADSMAYQQMILKILKSRTDRKTDKNTILRSGLVSYAKYGDHSPFTDILSKEQLQVINPENLTSKITQLSKYPHRVLYYGSSSLELIKKKLKKAHKSKVKLDAPDLKKDYKYASMDKPMVYFCDYDMVQSEVIVLSKSTPYDTSLIAPAQLFNEYFGGNMSSIVFQEIREARALAYSVYSYYALTEDSTKNNFVVSYVGTQTDKLPEALGGMNGLLDSIPYSDEVLSNAKQSLRKQIASKRVTKASVLFEDLDREIKGQKRDYYEITYNYLVNADFSDVKSFHQQYVAQPVRVYLVIGDKESVNFDELSKLGEVKELSLEELFGY